LFFLALVVAAPAISSASAGASSASSPNSVTAKSAGATTARPRAASDLGRLTLIRTIGGSISPKSVDASGTGLVLAQNMMYRDTMTVYNSVGQLVRTISDGVNMSQFGFPRHPGVTRGAPVEAAFTLDGTTPNTERAFGLRRWMWVAPHRSVASIGYLSTGDG
jgi:hypothetical protein